MGIIRWGSAFVALIWALAAGAEPGAGRLSFDGAGPAEAVHLGTDFELTVEGLEAEVTLTQRFKNPSSEWMNAVYVYPLPDDSAVTRLTLTVGERVVEGRIEEKQKARAQFEKAKAAGQKAALVEQQRANLFRQQVANIGPGETVTVRIGYTQQVIYEAGEFRLRLPTTLTPRYIPGVTRGELAPKASVKASTGWATATDEVWDAALITPPQRHARAGEVINPMTFTLNLDAGMPLADIDSATHQLSVEMTGQHERRITLANGPVSMDRDLELVWQPRPASAPVAAAFTQSWQGDRYAQIMLMPPREMSESQRLPRELILVVDNSGSMAGTSIVQARESALMALERLSAGDRFNLVIFNSQTKTLFDRPVAASADNLNRARRALQGLQADGGTEMAPALAAAFRHREPEGFLKQVVFVTDGSVGNESALLKKIHRSLDSARLFTVAIGSAPNRFFMRRAARFGRGTFTEIATSAQVQKRMGRLLGQLEKPVVADLAIDWPQPVEVYPRKVPDLYWGEPLLVTAKLAPWPLKGDPTVTLSGRSAGKRWERTISLAGADKPAGQGVPVLAQRFGREKIAFWDDKLHRSADRDKARAKLLPVALNYQLMSRFTSLVAVDKTPSRPADAPLRDGAVPNAMPAGSQMRAVGYPQTAAGTLWHWLLGATALMLLTTIRLTGGRRYE